MKRSRFSEEQIIAILREQEAGTKTVEVCRKHGISDATFYKWKAKYGGMEVPDARRLKALEDENAKLKRLLAEAVLDNAMLKDVAAKNGGARGQTRGRGIPWGGLRGEPAAGVPGDRGRSQFGPLSQQAARGWRHSDPASRTCRFPPALRL